MVRAGCGVGLPPGVMASTSGRALEIRKEGPRRQRAVRTDRATPLERIRFAATRSGNSHRTATSPRPSRCERNRADRPRSHDAINTTNSSTSGSIELRKSPPGAQAPRRSLEWVSPTPGCHRRVAPRHGAWKRRRIPAGPGRQRSRSMRRGVRNATGEPASRRHDPQGAALVAVASGMMRLESCPPCGGTRIRTGRDRTTMPEYLDEGPSRCAIAPRVVHTGGDGC